MKYLIVSALLAITSPLFAQTNYSKNYIIAGGKVSTYSSGSVTTAIKFDSGTGENGSVKKDGNITYINYCQNTRDSSAVKTNNKRDTTNYRISVLKADNVITITHPNAQKSVITDEGDLIMVKAAGGLVAIFHKSTSAISTNPEQKGNVTMIVSQDVSYEIMITTGKTAVVVNSDGTYSLAIKENDRVAVMPSEGFHSFIYNEDAKLKIIYANGEEQKTVSYGCLGLFASKNDN